jgi:hypothetical protein
MANNASTYTEQARANYWRGTQLPTPPANLYLALFTTMPTAQDGTGAVEVSGGGYARQAIPGTTAAWTAPAASGTGQIIKNVNAVNFPQATAAWGTILGAGLYDASTGGNLIDFATFSNGSHVIGNGDTFQFAANAITILED